MENCVAPGLDEFDVIIRSCIVFSQSISLYRSLNTLYKKRNNKTFEPRHEKNCLRDLRPGKTQTGLLRYRG